VLPVVPEVVTLSEEGYTIQYGPITALLVEAVKEQQKQMDKCRQENLELKSELESLREEIKEIKRALYK
jgi:cell division protein FtsB